MDCKNHPGVMATNRCAGCAQLFCNNCLVNIQGQVDLILQDDGGGQRSHDGSRHHPLQGSR